MIFFDTNVLVYSTVKQDTRKTEISNKFIISAIEDGQLLISPLVLIEYIYVLSKNSLNPKVISEGLKFFENYSYHYIDTELVREAISLSNNLDMGTSINDCVHLKYAEKYCNKLITFDSDFKKLVDYTNVEIEVLK